MISLTPYQTPAQPTPAAAAAAGPSMFVKVLPFMVNTTAAVIAHQWHYQGASHSIGDAVICGGIAAVALGVGAALSKIPAIPPTALALAYGTGGALLGVSVIGYAQAPTVALLAWLGGMVISYALATTGWTKRADRREERAHERDLLQLQEESKTKRTQIKADAQVSVARELSSAWAAEKAARDAEQMARAEFDRRYPAPVPLLGAVTFAGARPVAALDDAQLLALSGQAGFPVQGDGLDVPEWLNQDRRRDER